MEYLPYMRTLLSKPLANEGASAVESVISTLDAYDLMREDFDSIMELTAWSTSANSLDKVDSKVTQYVHQCVFESNFFCIIKMSM
jgi:replication factor C subunit 1